MIKYEMYEKVKKAVASIKKGRYMRVEEFYTNDAKQEFVLVVTSRVETDLDLVTQEISRMGCTITGINLLAGRLEMTFKGYSHFTNVEEKATECSSHERDEDSEEYNVSDEGVSKHTWEAIDKADKFISSLSNNGLVIGNIKKDEFGDRVVYELIMPFDIVKIEAFFSVLNMITIGSVSTSYAIAKLYPEGLFSDVKVSIDIKLLNLKIDNQLNKLKGGCLKC